MSTEKVLSILFALGSGTMNALTTVNAKFMVKRGNYDAMSLSSDTGLFLAATCFLFALCFTVLGHSAISLYNLGIGFVSACLNMMC
jgi:hypothetical protein